MKHYEETDLATTIARLKHELRALGNLAEGALGLRAERGESVNDLADAFDHWCLCVLSSGQGKLTVRQQALLNALDAYFDALSVDGQEELWTDRAIRERPEWADIRSLARQALDSLGGEIEPTNGEACDGAGPAAIDWYLRPSSDREGP